LERIHHELYVAVREQEGREPSPTANVQDRDGAFPLIRRARQLFPLIERIFADGGYAGRKMAMTVPFRQGHKRFRQVVLSIGQPVGDTAVTVNTSRSALESHVRALRYRGLSLSTH